jgi:hypothetical protein
MMRIGSINNPRKDHVRLNIKKGRGVPLELSGKDAFHWEALRNDAAPIPIYTKLHIRLQPKRDVTQLMS